MGLRNQIQVNIPFSARNSIACLIVDEGQLMCYERGLQVSAKIIKQIYRQRNRLFEEGRAPLTNVDRDGYTTLYVSALTYGIHHNTIH